MKFRHSAAATPDRGLVFQLIEEADVLDEDQPSLQNIQGYEAFQRYRAAVWRFATAQKPADVMSEVQFEEWDFATNPNRPREVNE
jgi:hypothetical protein